MKHLGESSHGAQYAYRFKLIMYAGDTERCITNTNKIIVGIISGQSTYIWKVQTFMINTIVHYNNNYTVYSDVDTSVM